MLRNLFRKKIKKEDPQKELADWEANGKPFPPPHIVKQRAIAQYRSVYKTGILVETGTYLGDMVEAQKNFFDTVYSIELSPKLYKRAQKRFKGDNRIVLLLGDSGIKLSEVVAQLRQPAIFWLDGHYSGGITAKGDKECPVPEEITAIFKSPLPNIVLIDDARLFNGTHDYPTLEAIRQQVKDNRENYSMETKDDIIRLTPNF
jgi:hypothetical protein